MKNIGKKILADINQFKWAAIAFLLYNIVVLSVVGAFCPMVILTGLPCPGCGMTRALLCVLTGQFEKAFHYNACIYLWIPIGVYFFWKRYVKCSEQCNKQCSKRCCMWMPQLLAAAGVIMIIYYLYRMIFLFPGEEPLIFFSDNMLGRVIPVYNEIIEKRWNLGVTDISVL